MTPQEELARLNTEATALAKRRGELDNQRQAAINERKLISPKPDPDGVIVDPSDDNPELRPRRAELLKIIEALNPQIAEIDDQRRKLEPALNEARVAVEFEAAASKREQGRAELTRIAQLSIELQQAIGAYSLTFSQADAMYPMGTQLAPGRQVSVPG
jgi:hypothetical protein